MTQQEYGKLPLVYSCSGCSSVAQLANRLALELDREHVAEMSCIAGVGGGVPNLVKKARSGRPIIALDGCQLRCTESCLNKVDVQADHHFLLTDFGMKKQYHTEFDEQDMLMLKQRILDVLETQPVSG